MNNITLPRALIEQALETLENLQPIIGNGLLNKRQLAFIDPHLDIAITALRTALAEPAQEPITRLFGTLPVHDTQQALAQQAEPVEPVAWVASKDGRVIYDDASTDDGLLRVSGDFENDEQRVRYAQRIVDKLNAAPPQRKPLTEEEIESCRQQGYAHAGLSASFDFGKAARAVEKASWEKNHGQA